MKKYQVIYADPPWSYRFTSPTGSKRPKYVNGVIDYYPTMPLSNIQKLPVIDLSAKDAVCFLWATTPLLPEAMETLRKWGFRYKTCITWHKERCKGMGYWFRGHTEHLLFGVKGKISAFRSLVHNIQKLPVEKHSKKPDWFRGMIEEVTFDLPHKVELFAREKHEGWDVWGDEVESDIEI